MDEVSRARTMRLLTTGHIRAGYVYENEGRAGGVVRADKDPTTLILNTGDHPSMSAFNRFPADLAKLVMHEGWHIVQLAGMKPSEAAAHVQRFKPRLEEEAERYENAHFRKP